MKFIVYSILLLGVLGCSEVSSRHVPKETMVYTSDCMHDNKIENDLLKKFDEFLQKNRTKPIHFLISQLDKKKCQLQIPAETMQKTDFAAIYEKYKQSVLIVASRYLCGNCQKWHLSSSSGFIISSSGAFVTSYHVVNDYELDSIIVRMEDGTCFGVKEVLAADKDNDFAILQIDGIADFIPIPLKSETPVGTPVCVISHPARKYYSITDGIVSRYFTPEEYNNPEIRYLTITADYAKGSSGAPVIDHYGCVVGVVSYTQSYYYSQGKFGSQNLQMVFKHVSDAAAILQAIDSKVQH